MMGSAKFESGRMESGTLGSPIPSRIGWAALAMWMAVLVHHPVDSTLVEAGDGLWCGFVAFLLAAAGCVLYPPPGLRRDLIGRPQRLLAMPIFWFVALVAWLWLAWWFTRDVGGYRKGLNEWWWWATAAATLVIGRTWVRRPHRKAWAAIVVGCAAMLSLHALHGHFIVLPDLWQQYRSDPEAVLRSAGINGPPGSAARMIFENRLFDGGASATFALANSLGGFLVLGIPFCIGLPIEAWCRRSEASSKSPNEKPAKTTVSAAIFAMAAVVPVVLAAILVTRSRAAVIATLAMLLASSLVLLPQWRATDGSPESEDSHPDPVRKSGEGRTVHPVQRLVWVLMSFFGVCAAVALGIASFGRAEWLNAAPASLATRVRYWRATAELVSDRPMFGAGPGNFQSLSERYRDGVSSEQIADPHNFFWETVGAGGWPAGLLLIAFCGTAIRAATKARASEEVVVDHLVGQTSDQDALATDAAIDGVRIGFVLGIIGVWAFRVIDGAVDYLPYACDLAGLLVLLVATSSRMQRRPGRFNGSIRGVFAIAILGIALHLSVSGGWTVPGIAVPLLICIGSLLPSGRDASILSRPRRQRLLGCIAVAATLMALLYVTSWRPVTAAKRARSAAEYWMYEGSISAAKSSLRDAVAADPFDTQSALYHADLLRREIIARPSRSRRAVEAWTSAIEDARRGGGQSPPLYRQFGDQAISIYQRFGHPMDLLFAKRWYEFAVQFGPSEEVAWAQYALLLDAVGESAQAREAANRAMQLSTMTPNPERDLSRHAVQLVQPLEESNQFGSQNRPRGPAVSDAASAIRDLLEPSGRP